MNNTLYEILTSLNSNQEVLIVYEEEYENSIELYHGKANGIPMCIFKDCDIPTASLIRLETRNNLLIIVVA